MTQWLRVGGCSIVAFISIITVCPIGQGNQQESMAQKDINAVLRDHDKELLSIPGVVGVYVGLLPDGKTPCLKVMVVKESEDLKRRIPKTIEGYLVLIEESGVIHPLK